MRTDMIGRFEFNNVESNNFNLVCKSVKRPLLPAVKVKRVDLSGLSGVYDFDDNEYALRPVTMRIAYMGSSYADLRSKARDIAAWLSTPTWAKLFIHDEPDKYYLAKVTEEIDLESLWELGMAEIDFDCQPFLYAKNDVVFSFGATGAKNETFNNPGTRLINFKSPYGSKFLIEVTGTWTALGLGLNGKVLNYIEAKAGVGTVIFDNIEMEVTLGGVNKFKVLTGDIETFFHLVPGNNILYVDGVSIDVNVTVKFLPMWI